MSKKDELNKLLDCRNQIENILTDIDSILQSNFSDEHSLAYQHWIPQIKTALRDDTKWLPRGQYSMDYTLNKINDKLSCATEKGVSKFI